MISVPTRRLIKLMVYTDTRQEQNAVTDLQSFTWNYINDYKYVKVFIFIFLCDQKMFSSVIFCYNSIHLFNQTVGGTITPTIKQRRKEEAI